MISAETPGLALPALKSSIITGKKLQLICTIQLMSELISGLTLKVIWILPNHSHILAGNSVSNVETNIEGQRLLYSSRIRITSLDLSHAGIYVCDAQVTSTRDYVLNSTSNNTSTPVKVKGKL